MTKYRRVKILKADAMVTVYLPLGGTHLESLSCYSLS